MFDGVSENAINSVCEGLRLAHLPGVFSRRSVPPATHATRLDQPFVSSEHTINTDLPILRLDRISSVAAISRPNHVVAGGQAAQ